MLGLGQPVAETMTPGVNAWCNWMPFADFFDACKPMTPAQIRQNIQLGPAATPESRAELERRTTESWNAYCDMHPEECSGYKAAVECPRLAETLGPEIAASLGCDIDLGTKPNTPWLLYGLLLVGVVAVAFAAR
jgi:hypothetical protein